MRLCNSPASQHPTVPAGVTYAPQQRQLGFSAPHRVFPPIPPQIGIDAVAYVAFVRLCLELLLFTLPFDLSIVLWCNITGGMHLSQTTRSDIDPLTLGNVTPGSPRLWAHFGSALWKTAVCLRLLDKARASNEKRAGKSKETAPPLT